MTNCPNEQIIHLYHDGELDPHQAAECAAHLEQCAHCRAVLQDLRQLSGLFSHMPVSTPAAGFEDRVRARIQNQDTETNAATGTTDLIRWYHRLVPAAACLVLLLGALLAMQSSQPGQLEVLTPYQVTLNNKETTQVSEPATYNYVFTDQQSALLADDDTQTLSMFYSSLEEDLM